MIPAALERAMVIQLKGSLWRGFAEDHFHQSLFLPGSFRHQPDADRHCLRLGGEGLAGHRHHKSALLQAGRKPPSAPRNRPQCRETARLDVPLRARSPRRPGHRLRDILPIDRDSCSKHRAARGHPRCQDGSADAVRPDRPDRLAARRQAYQHWLQDIRKRKATSRSPGYSWAAAPSTANSSVRSPRAGS